MNLILFDDPDVRINLFPFTLTRPVAAIRVGIMTIAEKWEHYLNTKAFFKTETYLRAKFPISTASDNLLINGAVCPDETLAATVAALPDGYFLVKDTMLVAARNPGAEMTNSNTIEYLQELIIIDRTWKIFRENGTQLRMDFKRITAGRRSETIGDKYTRVYGEENIFLEEGVYIRAAILNAENGPIYLGKNSIIQEGAIIRGAFALCENSQINMGAKIRGDVTIGPDSKVGGEVSNSVIFGYSNKSHDGFRVVGILWTSSKLENTRRSMNIESVLDCGVHGDPKFVRWECETKDICHRVLAHPHIIAFWHSAFS